MIRKHPEDFDSNVDHNTMKHFSIQFSLKTKISFSYLNFNS